MSEVIRKPTNEVYETVTCTVPNQVTFNLTYMPLFPQNVSMFPQGGTKLINGIDFTVAGNVVSYTAPSPTFSIGENVLFEYTGV